MASYVPFVFDKPIAERTISSHIITAINGWQDSSLLVPHEAIRVMLDAFAKGLLLDDVQKVEAFEKLWSKWCFDFIFHHHQIEEETYMPWIYERVAQPKELVIEVDHETLIAEMKEISRVASEKTLEAGAKLPGLLRTFARGMAAHLANEETHVPQMLRDAGYTEEEEGAMIGKVMQSLTPEAFATMMPTIFYAMDKAGSYGPLTSAAFFATLPPPVQEAYPEWKATFEAEFLHVLETLAARPTPIDTAAAATIDGFQTPRVDTTATAFQADPAFQPDKTHLWKTPTEHDGWVHAHNAVRFEIGELRRVLEALGAQLLAGWQVQAVQAWWHGHETHVHEHHSNEDDIMNPYLRTRIRLPEKLEADHTQLIAAMEAIGAHMAGLAPGGSLAGLRPLWEHYEALMLPHLFEEEQVALPLARAYFTPAEIGKVTSEFLKKGDPVSLGSFVHVLGHKKDCKVFMREHGIPGFVWHVPGKGFKALRTLYRTKMQVHIDSLLAGEPVTARTKAELKENAAKATKAFDERIGAQCILSPSKRANVLSPRF